METKAHPCTFLRHLLAGVRSDCLWYSEIKAGFFAFQRGLCSANIWPDFGDDARQDHAFFQVFRFCAGIVRQECIIDGFHVNRFRIAILFCVILFQEGNTFHSCSYSSPASCFHAGRRFPVSASLLRLRSVHPRSSEGHHLEDNRCRGFPACRTGTIESQTIRYEMAAFKSDWHAHLTKQMVE